MTSRPPALITIHGIRSDNSTFDSLARECKSRLPDLPVWHINYRRQGARWLLTRAIRELITSRVAYKLSEAALEFSNHTITVVAHSWGTRALHDALRDERLGFTIDRLVLLGSILDSWTNWNPLHARGMLVERPLNIVRPFDLIVARSRFVGGGLSGTRGFSATDNFSPLNHFKRGGHNAYYPADVDDIFKVLTGEFRDSMATTWHEFRRDLPPYKRAILRSLRLGRAC